MKNWVSELLLSLNIVNKFHLYFLRSEKALSWRAFAMQSLGGLASESSFCSSLILVDSFSSPYLDRRFRLVDIYLLVYLAFIRPGWPELALFSVFYSHWLPRLCLSVRTGSRHSFCSWLSSPCGVVVECPNLLKTMPTPPHYLFSYPSVTLHFLFSGNHITL